MKDNRVKLFHENFAILYFYHENVNFIDLYEGIGQHDKKIPAKNDQSDIFTFFILLKSTLH